MTISTSNVPLPAPDLERDLERGRFLAPLALLLVGLALAFYPALGSGFGRLQIRLGDPTLVHYILEHTWRWVTDLPLAESFWDPPCYAPAQNVTARSDVMLGTAPVYWLWRALGAGLGASFQLWMMSTLSLTFVAMHLFLRSHVGARPWAAATGALLVAFGSAKLANFNSPQLFAVFPAIFALHFVGNALRAADRSERPAVRLWLGAFFAAATVQSWAAFYPAFFLALILLAAAAVALALPEPRRWLVGLLRQGAPTIVACMALTAFAVWPLASHHLEVARESGVRPWSEVAFSLPTASSWIFPGKSHWIYGGMSELGLFQFQGPPSQHANGVGFLTTIVALVGLWLGRRRALVQVVTLTAVLLMLVTMRYGAEGSPWKLAYEGIPGASAIRYLGRVGHFLAIPAALGVALALDAPRKRAPMPMAIAALVGALCVAEQAHRQMSRDEGAYRAFVSEVAERVPGEAPCFFVSTSGEAPRNPFRRESQRRQLHLAAMWAALEAGVPTANGFYGLDPAGWPLANPIAAGPEARRALDKACAAAAPAGTVHVILRPAETPWGRRSTR